MFETRKKTQRRRRCAVIAPEGLETRQLLTGGAGNSFALIGAKISQANGSVSVPFTLSSQSFTLPKGRMILGIDVANASGSTATPKIVSISDPMGKVLKVHPIHVGKGVVDNAVLLPISFVAGQALKTATFSVNVVAQGGTSGAITVDFYLPGDVAGTGTVTSTDLKTVKSLRGVSATSAKYKFAADTNRDGKINASDISYTKQNLGVSTTVTPYLSSSLDPSTDTAYPSRLTTSPVMRFGGVASPGAIVTYTSPKGVFSPVSTTVGSNGNYTVTVPLVKGQNYFNISSTDSFGQKISGPVTPVEYVNPTGA